MYFDETGFRKYFSEPLTAIRASTERPQYVINVILVIIFF